MFNTSYISALADPDSDGLTLVAQSDDIGDIGHIHLTKGEMEDFTATALPDASKYISIRIRPNQLRTYLYGQN